MKLLITLKKILKTVTSFKKLRVLIIRSQPSVSTRKEQKKKLKLLKKFSTLNLLLIPQYMKMETSHNG